MKPSYLILKNGAVFPGQSPDWQRETNFGEVVFTTGMTGYVESLTDPSYKGQILVFTYPLIGNYGVPGPEAWESDKIHVAGVVVHEACQDWSHPGYQWSLGDWLQAQNIPLITGIDTRELTKLLRSTGVTPGIIAYTQKEKVPSAGLGTEHAVAAVSIAEKKIYGNGKKKIIAVDCGMKENLIRSLLKFPVTVVRVPYDYDYTNDDYDGLFISNGPGDPEECVATVAHLKKALALKKPIFGICLGSQIMGLAAGGRTYKLPYGHRGQNQPCEETNGKHCVITSQNHGYAVDEKTLPKDWYVNFRNLNDGSVEGVAHKTLPYFSVQFHPEASPGPTDTMGLFEKFYKML